MSVDQLKKDIKEKNFSNFYLLYGKEAFLIRYYKKALLKSILGEDLSMNFISFEGKKIDIKELLKAANLLPFFSSYRVILVENSNLFSTKNELSEELSSLPSSTIFIFVEESIDRKTKLFKKVSKEGLVIDFSGETPENLTKWIINFCSSKQVSISKKDAGYLILRVGDNMDLLYLEMEKLVSYSYDKKNITKEDIDFICPETLQNKIYKLVDNIAQKDRQSALSLYYDLVDLKEDMGHILSLLIRQFRILLTARKLQDEGNTSMLREYYNLPPFVINNYLKLARNFSLSFLKNALDFSLSVENDIRNGILHQNIAVEKLIIIFTRKNSL